MNDKKDESTFESQSARTILQIVPNFEWYAGFINANKTLSFKKVILWALVEQTDEESSEQVVEALVDAGSGSIVFARDYRNFDRYYITRKVKRSVRRLRLKAADKADDDAMNELRLLAPELFENVSDYPGLQVGDEDLEL